MVTLQLSVEFDKVSVLVNAAIGVLELNPADLDNEIQSSSCGCVCSSQLDKKGRSYSCPRGFSNLVWHGEEWLSKLPRRQR